VQWAANLAVRPFAIERVGNLERVGVEFDDAAQGWTTAIDLVDALEIRLDQLAAAELTAFHLPVQLRDSYLFDVHKAAQDSSR
jgi:hypothetical protein